MARIRVLESIAGADFSWVPGDVVELPEEQAAAWADGHRAVRADDVPEATSVLGPAELAPVVTTVDGMVLRVVDAVVEEVDVPGPDGGSLAGVRWSVTVALPPDDPDAVDALGPVNDPESPDEPDTPDAPAVFVPGEHSNREVLAYLATAGEQEALRVLEEEAAGQDRAGIRKERDAVLDQARVNDVARNGRQEDAEKAAETSRGGGRGDGIETR
ncbi:hypothetical protein ACFXKG_18525 [Streptomyces sp. NPDC059255]|uniref:hypothetical protein n=1 Tax=Streptomyces sp. NPDC059255 TaxID=3346793 RepID=UPI00369B11C9